VDPAKLADGLVYYIVFLFSTTVHEAAHAWAAKLGGDLTAYHGGQVSLDPRPHIRREPFGMVLLPLISTLVSGRPFGFASAPYDPHWAVRHPNRAAWMALAGPAANVVLVIVALVGIRIGVSAGVFDAPGSVSFSQLVAAEPKTIWAAMGFNLSVLFSMNLVLACLNMFPVPPLDGSGVIMLFMSRATANRYQELLWSNRMLSIAGMLIAWKAFDYLWMPIFLTAVNFIHPGVTYG
jgi:Zn-dependent protease